jgi:DNA-binding transcriptional LysR family regulator
METRELRYFVAVAEELHFARAAARVGIEQSPLSKAISEFERGLGVQLFVRTRRSTRLTHVGEILLSDARRILAEIDQARLSIIAACAGRTGRLRVALCDGLAHPRISRLLALTRHEEPEVEVQIGHSSLPMQSQNLRGGALDIGFTLSPSNDPELQSLPLWQDAVIVIMRPDNPLAMQRSIRQITADMGTVILLGERVSNGHGCFVHQWLMPQEQSFASIQHVQNVELLLTMVAAGYGMGMLSAAQLETISRPDLVMRPLSVRGATITTFILLGREPCSALVDRFTERARKMV